LSVEGLSGLPIDDVRLNALDVGDLERVDQGLSQEGLDVRLDLRPLQIFLMKLKRI
jgi:hypothetical protein